MPPVDLAQRLTLALQDREAKSCDERSTYTRLANHYERAGLRGLAGYYREQAQAAK